MKATTIPYLKVKAFDPDTGEEVKSFKIVQAGSCGGLMGMRSGIVSSHENQLLELRATHQEGAKERYEKALDSLTSFANPDSLHSSIIRAIEIASGYTDKQ